MSNDANKATFDKGDRAAIVAGPKGVGVRGAVFWVGENKYGPGMRFGLRGDDGETYWVDESQIGSEDGAPPAPARPAAAKSSITFNKGDSVKIIGGPNAVGSVGQVFWTGDSKYGNGMRYGVRVGEDTVWVDGHQVEAASAPAQGNDASDEPPAGMFDDIPADAQPPEGELPPEAFDGDDMPPEAYEDDIPF